MTSPHTKTSTVRHPYEAGLAPRLLFLASAACLIGVLSAEVMAAVALLTERFEAFVGWLVVMGALWAAWRALRQRAWWSVPWRDQDGAAEPRWLTAASTGMPIALIVAAIVVTARYDRTALDTWAVSLAWGTGASTVRAVLGHRNAIPPRWRAVRTINAVVVLVLTAGVFAAALATVKDPGAHAVPLGIFVAIAAIIGAVMAAKFTKR